MKKTTLKNLKDGQHFRLRLYGTPYRVDRHDKKQKTVTFTSHVSYRSFERSWEVVCYVQK